MKATDLVARYLSNPKPRVSVCLSPGDGLHATFLWDRGQWWLEFGADRTQENVNDVNAFLEPLPWRDVAHSHSLPDDIQVWADSKGHKLWAERNKGEMK